MTSSNALTAEFDEALSMVLVRGDETSLRRLASVLRSGARVDIEPRDAVARQGLVPVERIVVTARGSAPSATVESDQMVIAAPVGDLRRLADEVDLFVEHNDLDEPGMHMHLLDADAMSPIAIVVAGPVADC